MIIADSKSHMKKRPGGVPRWANKYPQIMELMEKTDLRVYEIASILDVHPDSLGRKLRYGTLSDEETSRIITEVQKYMDLNRQHSGEES